MSRLWVQLELSRGDFKLQTEFRSESGRMALLGPSGAGKSTILGCLAGMIQPDRGRIEVDGDVILDTVAGICVPPRHRRMGLVTQLGTLFPHMSVEQNLTFAVRSLPLHQRPSRKDARSRAREALEELGLGALAERLPSAVSGGEARRAELARALIGRPRLVLLDEPFSALDPVTKAATVEAFRSSLSIGIAPWVLVTHDRDEALGLADEIGIIVDGQVRQVGAAHDVFFRPADARVAEFLGGELVWEGKVVEEQGDLVRLRVGRTDVWAASSTPNLLGSTVIATLRPEDVTLWRSEVPLGGSSRNALEGSVVAIEPRGLHVLVRLDIGIPMAALLTRGAASELEPKVGGRFGVSFKATRVHLIPRVSSDGLGSKPEARQRTSER